jgi:hypothetical protein
MQERRSRRAAAAITAALLLIVGWLGARHEAEVAHVRDHKGDMVHAPRLEGHHEVGPTAHLHGREVHSHDDGRCSLLAVAHASIAVAKPAAAVIAALAQEVGAPPVAAVHSAIAGYRLAPKTSPPALI